jgi:hypothetical protein
MILQGKVRWSDVERMRRYEGGVYLSKYDSSFSMNSSLEVFFRFTKVSILFDAGRDIVRVFPQAVRKSLA